MIIFATDVWYLQVSHYNWATLLLFCRTAGTADPVATLNITLMCCFQITASLFGFASKPQRLLRVPARVGNRWGNILGLFTCGLLWSKCWHRGKQFIVQSHMVYIHFLQPKMMCFRLFLTNSLKPAGFTLSEGNTGYICESTFLGALGELWIPHLFPGLASTAFSLSHKKNGLLHSENNLKIRQIKVYRDHGGCFCFLKKGKIECFPLKLLFCWSFSSSLGLLIMFPPSIILPSESAHPLIFSSIAISQWG